MSSNKNCSKLIDAVAAMAYGSGAVDFDLEDVINDFGTDCIEAFVPISIESLAGRDGDGFCDSDLRDHLGLDDSEEITSDLRISYASERFDQWASDYEPCVQAGACGNWITDTQDRKALVGYEVYGGGLGEVDREFVGVYEDEEEFRQHYRCRGYRIVDEDFPDKSLLLKYWRFDSKVFDTVTLHALNKNITAPDRKDIPNFDMLYDLFQQWMETPVNDGEWTMQEIQQVEGYFDWLSWMEINRPDELP